MTAPPYIPLSDVERVLVVVAHPDDVDFGAAGSIATFTDAGLRVTYCLLTDGDAGGFDDAVDRTAIPAIRQAEQRAAADAVGVSDLIFLGYPDGRLSVTHELRRDIARVIRVVRPDRVLTSAPERNYRRIGASHPDHLVAGEATLRAIYPDARNAYAHPELLAVESLAPWKVREVWQVGSPQPNHYVDITDVVERKISALKCHVSQTPDMDVAGFVRTAFAAQAQMGGLPEGRLAEAFHIFATA
ncbi:MAG: PIG-L family deacetylase [Geodermatophilaceae bacterium]|nr:PIG-L family deacetylase [Geodermatophilaceae bacterium]